MATVYFNPSVGGDGSTVTDDSDPSTGLGAGGHRTKFVPCLSNTATVACSIRDQGGEAGISRFHCGHKGKLRLGLAATANDKGGRPRPARVKTRRRVQPRLLVQ